ncbi:caspase family protein [Nitrospira sp. NS4]|uniref:caspase family protein n=1 Tax=Nitrospira sp. NS4 TaxID=3414498 RepID=UPI003C2D99E3
MPISLRLIPRLFPRIPRALSLSVAGALVAVCVGIQPAHAQLGKPEGLYYKSWAVVIGVENYLLAPPIPGAVNDAKTVAQAFRQMGFDEVLEVYDKDASFRHLQQVFTNFLPRKVGRMDRLVVFYAGHAGVTQDADGKDLGYLVPWDAQVNNVAKSVTFEQLKEFTRRSASKHTLLIIDAAVRGWETTAPQQLSLEGRVSPEEDTERRAAQVITAGDKGEVSLRPGGKSLFATALLTGLQGAADLNKNGWLMASELGAYLEQEIAGLSQGKQHPISARLDGDGDTVLVEGRKSAFILGAGPQTPAERQQAAKAQYEQAFALLQEGKRADEALERLNRAIEYNPAFGDAYVLKSYLLLEVLPNLDEALVAGQLAVQHAPDNPDSSYTLGLIYEKRGSFVEAEQALLQALKVNPGYQDVYFSLGTLYADHLNDQPKSVEAFRRYLELGGSHSRAKAVVREADAATRR